MSPFIANRSPSFIKHDAISLDFKSDWANKSRSPNINQPASTIRPETGPRENRSIGYWNALAVDTSRDLSGQRNHESFCLSFSLSVQLSIFQYESLSFFFSLPLFHSLYLSFSALVYNRKKLTLFLSYSPFEPFLSVYDLSIQLPPAIPDPRVTEIRL